MQQQKPRFLTSYEKHKTQIHNTFGIQSNKITERDNTYKYMTINIPDLVQAYQ